MAPGCSRSYITRKISQVPPYLNHSNIIRAYRQNRVPLRPWSSIIHSRPFWPDGLRGSRFFALLTLNCPGVYHATKLSVLYGCRRDTLLIDDAGHLSRQHIDEVLGQTALMEDAVKRVGRNDVSSAASYLLLSRIFYYNHIRHRLGIPHEALIYFTTTLYEIYRRQGRRD